MPASGENEQDQPTQRRAARGAAIADAPAEGGEQPLSASTARSDDRAADEPAVEIDERRAKMERLRAEGIDPYPHVSLHDRTLIKDVIATRDPSALAKGEHPELPYHLAGRLISRRGHGKTAFLDLRDLSGSIQIVLRAGTLGQEAYERILNLDVGDIIGVQGCVYVTQRGELALAARECSLLT